MNDIEDVRVDLGILRDAMQGFIAVATTVNHNPAIVTATEYAAIAETWSTCLDKSITMLDEIVENKYKKV